MRRSVKPIVPRYVVISVVAIAVSCSGLFATGFVPGSTSATIAHADKANVGRLKVKVKPKKARQDGGQWSVDGGTAWYNHKELVYLNPGDYTVEFKDINGWVAPNDKSVTIELFKLTKAKGKYARN